MRSKKKTTEKDLSKYPRLVIETCPCSNLRSNSGTAGIFWKVNRRNSGNVSGRLRKLTTLGSIQPIPMMIATDVITFGPPTAVQARSAPSFWKQQKKGDQLAELPWGM